MKLLTGTHLPSALQWAACGDTQACPDMFSLLWLKSAAEEAGMRVRNELEWKLQFKKISRNFSEDWISNKNDTLIYILFICNEAQSMCSKSFYSVLRSNFMASFAAANRYERKVAIMNLFGVIRPYIRQSINTYLQYKFTV